MIAYRLIIVILSLTTAKYLQTWVAAKLGDPTPKVSGRLTINPLAHIDIFGTIILPLLLLALSSGKLVIGYARRLSLNEYHLKRMRRDRFLLAMTIVLAHLVIGACCAFLLKIAPSPLREPLLFFIQANTMLIFFNLIPIPPLEGAKIFASFLPQKICHSYLRLERYGDMFIAILFMLGIVPTYMRLATASLLRHIYGL